jgi:hypothetical protein
MQCVFFYKDVDEFQTRSARCPSPIQEGQDGREHEGRGSERGPHGEQRTDDDARPPRARGAQGAQARECTASRDGRGRGAVAGGAGDCLRRHARSCFYTQTFPRGKWKRVY